MDERIIVKGKKKTNVFAMILLALGVVVLWVTLLEILDMWKNDYGGVWVDLGIHGGHIADPQDVYPNFIRYYFGEMFRIRHSGVYEKFPLIGYLLTIVAGVILFKTQRSQIVVCEARIVGNLGYGKPVEIPMLQVKELKPCKFSGITILTTSGEQSFYSIKNRDEVMRAIAMLIENKTPSDVSAEPRDHIEQEDLIKLKELFEQGVITQEEFSAKKKQILGL